jgi:Carboxypeptidase regulatory-like domain
MRVSVICSTTYLMALVAGAPLAGALDITDTPFDFGVTAQTITGADVAISNGAATISGHVTDSAAAPVSKYAVVVFSTDRRTWSTGSRVLRLARPAQDGSFEVASLPPGEYWVAAIDPVEGNEVSGDWLTPEALEKLSFRARRVTLAERERHMTVLRLIR